MARDGDEDGEVGRDESAVGSNLPIEGPRLFEQLVRNTADAVLVADRSGTIQFWNESAARVFGYERDEAIGETLDLIIPERFREDHWAGFARTMDAGETPYDPGELLSVPALRDDGGRIFIELTITELRDADSRLTGLGAIVRDVTDRDDDQ